MTNYRRGDVVLVRFPYADLINWGMRPALVVQDENVRTELSHYILAQITKTPRTGPTRVPVSKESADGKAMSLLHDSVIVTDVLASTEAELIERRLGTCPCMQQVDAALKTALRL